MPFYEVWLAEREKILIDKNKSHNRLFIKADGNPAIDSTLHSWTKEFEKYLGVPLYSHALRHYMVTLLSKKNIPYSLIQALMGWSSSEMVQVYDDSSAKDKNYPELNNLKV